MRVELTILRLTVARLNQLGHGVILSCVTFTEKVLLIYVENFPTTLRVWFYNCVKETMQNSWLISQLFFFLIAFERMEHSSPRGSKNYTNHSLDVHLKMASNSSGIHLCGLDWKKHHNYWGVYCSLWTEIIQVLNIGWICMQNFQQKRWKQNKQFLSLLLLLCKSKGQYLCY